MYQITETEYFSQLILKALKECHQLQTHLESLIKKMPEGTLRISQSHGRFYLHINKKTTDKYIAYKNRKLACNLAQKSYIKKLNKQLTLYIRWLEQLQQTIPSPLIQIYTNMSSERKQLVDPLIQFPDSFASQWQLVAYAKKEMAQETTEYYTEKGEQVRSKSELLIAGALYKKGVPYRYEYPVEIKTKSGSVTFHPDFYCLNSNNREIIWEHFGLMNDTEYVANFLRKMQLYYDNGWYPGINLICTFESTTQPLNTRIIDQVIQVYLKK